MTDRVQRQDLAIDKTLCDFIEGGALDGTGVALETFWSTMSSLAHELGPKNAALLKERAVLQDKIDAWHIERRGQTHDHQAYKAFLTEIGYLVPEGDAFQIDTANVDPEIAEIAGPQLVVPITNARYALNAANARWGSLYDGFYGTDAMGTPAPKGGYDVGRGARVVARARVFLDEAFPVDGTSHADARRYSVLDGALLVDDMPLANPEKFVGFRGHPKAPDAVLLRNNGMHVELVFDRTHMIGARDQAGLADVVMESALSAIMDCEDSVACVDGEDKALAYRNWLGLMKGDLEEQMEKGGKSFTRALNPDRVYTAPDGGELVVKGRALMLVRNVGHLMTNPAILDRDGNEIYEGLMDALVTTALAMHDLKRDSGNSVRGSVYVVKPKMHGPKEVAFTDEIFTMVEGALGLPKNTVKIGIMDEERRTTVNLKECIRAAKSRVAFINTGFLDRTGDEIHTSMEAGPFSRKDFIKRKPWIMGYENQNVDIGLECGLSGRAQIGKGMWAMPDMMGTEDQIMREVENNAQGILGYVVRWVGQGVGCSKVPDINDVGLMEDRATCRISSQALANWLHHDVVNAQQVMGAMHKMAAVVDGQNAGDPAYEPMAPEFSGIPFQAACDLVFKGRVQPSGYTEPVLHARRLELKAK